MKAITKKQFLADVMHEIEMIKKHATDSEVSKLDFDEFDPTNSQQCIYGQITGSCENQRAAELIEKCCSRVFDFKEKDIVTAGHSVFTDFKKYINGTPVIKSMFSGNRLHSRDYTYLSALEGYIHLDSAKNEQIIQYIKGEIENLTL